MVTSPAMGQAEPNHLDRADAPLRVVMFVLNDCRTDARVLREAGTLAAIGHTVTIIARPTDLNDQRVERERRDGFEIVRIPVPARWRQRMRVLVTPWAARKGIRDWVEHQFATPPAGWLRLLKAAVLAVVAIPFVAATVLVIGIGRLVPGTATIRSGVDWLVRWRISTEEWDRAAAAAAPAADVYHAHDLNALHAAVIARATHGGALVYDSHEIFLESGRHATRPDWARRVFRRREAAWLAEADALVTVNLALAEELGRRYAPRRVVVLHNAPARWEPPSPGGPDELRRAAGIAPGAPVLLYHGSMSRHRGLDELVEAIADPALTGAHLVFLGYGAMAGELRAKAEAPDAGGRVHLLAAVPPSDLLRWVHNADVAVMPIQDSTLNHRLSTPNKLFEALAAGVPVVISDLPEMRRIALEDPSGPLGAACDPRDPRSIAAAAASILRLPEAGRAALRSRCLEAAHGRWNWERESEALVGLYRDLAARRTSEA